MEDELVQYFVVNSELEMSAGKVATQVSHVALQIAYDNIRRSLRWNRWYNNNQTKIILKGKEKDLLKLMENGAYHIRDIGRTEVSEGSLTCVGFLPRPKSEMKKLVGRLRLL